MCPSSVVRRSSCVVNNFFKHLLLPNCRANLDQTWQECSLGCPLQNCSQNLIPSKTLVAIATKFNFLSNSLNISSGTADQILKQFHRNVPLVTLFKNCSRNFDPSKNTALVNGGFLHYTDMKKFFKHLLLWNHWSDFEIISQECSLCDPFQNFDPSVNMALVNGGLLHYTDMKKFFKNFLVRNHLSYLYNFTGMFLLWPFSKNCSRSFDPSLNMALVNGGFLHYTDMKKFINNLQLRNRWSDFEIFSQECSLGDPFQILFAKISVSIRVFIADTGGFWSLTCDEQMYIKLCTEILYKKWSIKSWLLWKTHFPFMV